MVETFLLTKCEHRVPHSGRSNNGQLAGEREKGKGGNWQNEKSSFYFATFHFFRGSMLEA